MGDWYIIHGELAHSKGKWKKHKYIRKEGNRYIYPEDLINDIGKKIDNTKIGTENRRVRVGGQTVYNKTTPYRIKNARKDTMAGLKKAGRQLDREINGTKKRRNNSGIVDRVKNKPIGTNTRTVKIAGQTVYKNTNLYRVKDAANDTARGTKRKIKKGRKHLAKYLYKKVAGI